MSKVEVDKVIPQSGTTLTIGDSGDTINIVGTLQNNGAAIPGDISSVVAGTGLSGGGTSGDVTLNVEAAQSGITSLGTLTALNVAGNATITTADNSNTLSLVSTDADATSGPRISMRRESGSPADDDIIGQIYFTGKDDGGNNTDYASIRAKISDTTDNTEDGALEFQSFRSGFFNNSLTLGPTETVFNDDSVDIDFRVESNGNADMLNVDAGTNRVGIGLSNPQNKLDIKAETWDDGLTIKNTGNFNTGIIADANRSSAGGGLLNLQGRWNGTEVTSILFQTGSDTTNKDDGEIVFRTAPSGTPQERVKITSAGNVGIGTSAPGSPLTVSGGTNSTVANINNTVSATTDLQNILLLQSNTSGSAGVGHGVGIAFNAERNDGNNQRYGDFGFSANTNSGTSLKTDCIIKLMGGHEVLRLKQTSAGSQNEMIAPDLLTTGTTSNRYPLYWVHNGTVGSIQPYTGSVREMKTDINDMSSVDWIHSLRPRSFKFRDFETNEDGSKTYLETTNDEPNTEYGLIAEEVNEVNGSDYILDKQIDEDGNENLKGVLYHNLVPVLLKAVQEQKKTIQELEARITTLENA